MWKLLKIIRGLDIIVSWVMEFLTWGYKISLKLSKNMNELQGKLLYFVN